MSNMHLAWRLLGLGFLIMWIARGIENRRRLLGRGRRWRMKFLFAWYDMWVGAYWDGDNRRLYIFPLPMLGMVFANRRDPIVKRKKDPT